ncbi:sulfurtransferase [Jeongeupia naejangsanensis]|uniref:Sulfurtransferase n=1 Tax=Jeongeupia naejangsanensis TaxID=613195 RepID=A0ABS2BGN8_9NEIS|nr:sulfurtransferase [Jeongeupia naejangsanensis]MBM3114625.1 sulfurtransferase [Jeongeupia naejangsanensis]
MPLLMTPQALATSSNGFVVVDCRHDLADPEAGRIAYASGHIPGAVFAHLDLDLSGSKTGRNGRHPLPDPDALMCWAGRMGIGAKTQVVAYDASGGMFAARLWWLLRWLGHEHVAVLDGGWQAWLEAGLPVSAGAVTPTAVAYEAVERRDAAVDMAQVRANLEAQDFLVVDARSPDRYRGLGETIDPVGGHIPGAANRFFQHNLNGSGRFKSADVLRAEWQEVLAGRSPADIVCQCGSGVTACHNLLALEVAGLPGARLYPGSWSEWCAHPDNPVAS